MTRAEFLKILANGSDEEVVDSTWQYLPETESDDETGHETGDPLALIAYADSEIRNGGFYQFYSNGIFDALNLHRLLDEIGASEVAKCIRSANQVFPEGMPPYRGSREVEEVELELEEMGVDRQTFIDLEGLYYIAAGSLGQCMADHIRAHPERYGPAR